VLYDVAASNKPVENCLTACSENHFAYRAIDIYAPVGKQVLIYSRKSHRLLSSNGGTHPMTFDRSTASGWEVWVVADAGDGLINLI